jgi:transposase
MATTSKWCSASHRQAAALPRRPAPLAETPQTGKIVQAVVERLFAWLSRYRRLNIVYDRAPDLFAGHVWIAMISIISRRLVAQTQAQ